MAVTGTISATLLVPTTSSERQSHEAAIRADKAAAEGTRIAVPSPDAPKEPQHQALAAFSLTVHFDQDLRRLILEERDPASGFVIFQLPPKYVLKQFSASVSGAIEPARGAKVDNAV